MRRDYDNSMYRFFFMETEYARRLADVGIRRPNAMVEEIACIVNKEFSEPVSIPTLEKLQERGILK